MHLRSVNPMDGDTLNIYEEWNGRQIQEALQLASMTAKRWSQAPVSGRCALLHQVAQDLRKQQDELAQLITLEMGKLLSESKAEIEKCAWVCEYYAEQTEAFLADEEVATEAERSYIRFQPLGVVLAVMPWNFPFWQAFRFAVPAMLVGNAVVLKHASNVPQCSLAIDRIFKEAGLPTGVFQSMMISAGEVDRVIANDAVSAVTFTGSEASGREVALSAARNLKKTVMELGGSDPFVVLDDAGLGAAVKAASASRFMNAGQSCIAAKRFILTESIADDFLGLLKREVEHYVTGNPAHEETTLAPMARHNLRDSLHKQVLDSRARGATAVTGCMPGGGAGAFYQASIMDNAVPGMRVFDEEVFGPVAVITRAKDDEHAIRLANQTRYGLGASIWTLDLEKGERLAQQIEAGSVFLNEIVKSDPRLPFGGIKASGYGRELSRYGMLEFTNIKSIWIK